jgi:carboxypeptidase Taq
MTAPSGLAEASPTPSPFDLLCGHTRETSLLNSIESLLGWDERTLLPPAAAEYRAEQMTYLSGLIHRRQTDPRVGEWLAELVANGAAKDPQSDIAVTLRQIKRQYDRKTRLPQSLVEELTRTTVLGQQAWVEARRNNDFDSFRPWLEKIFELKRQEADALGHSGCRYDALLDEYEPGESTEHVSRVLAGLREELIPLVGAIRDCDRKPDLGILKRRYPVAAQEQFGRLAAERIGFEFQRGRLDVTAHPFCTEIGPHDCRITTRFDEHFFSSAFFGILHEAGHGIYEQGLRTDQYGLPLGQYVSMGIHESQSRLWENMVGRSRAFWEYFYPEAKRLFPEALDGVSLDDFHFAINDVRPSLIRVEADEVTYNLHIIIRFELEQALLAGDLPVADLPAAWNEKYRQYLGIEPPNHSDGVLQDIHWSAGLLGYFPTYSLGNLYAAQFFAQADKDLGGLAPQFAKGEFGPLRDWLREKIHRQGQRYTAAELAKNITTRDLAHNDLIDYLLAKMEPLYSGPPSASTTTPPAEAPVTTATMGEQVLEPAATSESGATATTTSDSSVKFAAMMAAAEATTTTTSTLKPGTSPSDQEASKEAAAESNAAERSEGESQPAGSAETMTEVVPDPPWTSEFGQAGVDAGFDAAALRTGPRRQEYQVGVLGNFIGIVVFGFVGLFIGYWLLNFFGGPRFNFLDIWLPFVSHTQGTALDSWLQVR